MWYCENFFYKIRSEYIFVTLNVAKSLIFIYFLNKYEQNKKSKNIYFNILNL